MSQYARWPTQGGGGGSGTVTSVGISAPSSILTITGSPITTSGTFVLGLATQAANTVWAGPTSGSAATPTFRALVMADLPSGTGTVTSVSVVSANGLAGTVATATTTPAITLSTTITGILQGNGTAISAASTTGSGAVVLATSPTLVTPALGTPTALTLTNATGLPLTTGVTGVLPIANGGTGAATTSQNYVFAGPTSGSGAPSFRLLTSGDVPTSVTTVGTIDSQTPSSNGLVISGADIYAQSASASNPGMVNNTTQTFSGSKTIGSNASDAITLGGASSTAVQIIRGGVRGTVRTITSNLTLDTTTTDYQILCNQSAAITITLPAPTAGRMFLITDISGTAQTNTITLAPHASEMIEGLAASKVFQTNYGSWEITSDGTNWFINASGARTVVAKYSSSGSWTAPAGVTNIIVYGRPGAGGGSGGAGGGGGYGGSTAGGGGGGTGGGGGGSASIMQANLTVSPGTAYTITVGAGGAGSVGGTAGAAGGAGGGSSNATDGGVSSFDALVTFGMGNPATGGTAASGTGSGGAGQPGTSGAGGGGGYSEGAAGTKYGLVAVASGSGAGAGGGGNPGSGGGGPFGISSATALYYGVSYSSGASGGGGAPAGSNQGGGGSGGPGGPAGPTMNFPFYSEAAPTGGTGGASGMGGAGFATGSGFAGGAGSAGLNGTGGNGGSGGGGGAGGGGGSTTGGAGGVGGAGGSGSNGVIFIEWTE